jgi:DHA3 family tetracycline resistance protein-like MFS transporter
MRTLPKPRIVEPLRIRDFALLSGGLALSMLGDGIYLVAIAWQVYELSDAPTALSLVGVAWTAPLLACVLLGGVVSDRFDRRSIMLAAVAARAVAIGSIGVLSVLGVLELWHVIALVALFGIGEAFYGPAQAAIVPQIVPSGLLVQANSLGQLANPLAMRLAGPAIGGLAVAGIGAGGTFLLAAGSLAASGAAFALMRRYPIARPGVLSLRQAVVDVVEGFRYARSQPWIWGTLLASAASLLAFWGPVEVLLPYVVKHELGGDARDLGLVFAAGGLGAVVAALVCAQRGLPRRHMTVLYVSWSLATLAVAGFGIATELWHAMVAEVAAAALGAVAMIVWMTLTHRLVPLDLRGRVESVDWLVSVGLVPVSFALTGPIAALIGVRATLVGAGVLGALAAIAFLFFPGMRDTERDGTVHGLEREHELASSA